GTMGGGTSPRDPIFFLHHNFVDKLWQEWYDSDNGIVKTPYTFTTPATTYWTWPSISPNVINDSRYMQFQATTSSPVTNEEVWYAYNQKLVLDGMNGIPFNVTGTNRLYCYTAWNGISVNGEIFAGDLKRDTSNNIIPDNRGGIKIKSGATCAFNAGSSINILPGFESEYGAVFEANVVALPCGFNSLRTDGEISDIKDVEEVNNENQLYVYSDLSNTISVNYTLYTGSKITIQLFNTMGQMVYSLGLGAQPEGYHQHNINIQLAAGIYFCRLVTDNSQQSVKFVY
ncbi:MAG TPA: tyrosinase family protein, partial [Bacteroidia bacterium]|nr:tyrosinase family protein [Bacteroidia bacterium]